MRIKKDRHLKYLAIGLAASLFIQPAPAAALSLDDGGNDISFDELLSDGTGFVPAMEEDAPVSESAAALPIEEYEGDAVAESAYGEENGSGQGLWEEGIEAPISLEEEELRETTETSFVEAGAYDQLTDGLADGLSIEETLSGDIISGGLIMEDAPSDELSSGLSGDPDNNGIRYVLGRPMTEEEEMAVFAPFVTLPEAVPAFEVGSSAVDEVPGVYAASLPTAFDARSAGIVTVPKNQGSYQDCWAFTLASIMETSLLKQGLGAFDLSEEHLAFFWANRMNDPLGNTPYDFNYHTHADYRNGGNPYTAAMFLSTWSGMALDSAYPTPTSWSENLRRRAAYDTAACLKDAVFSDYYTVERTKQLVRYYGSASTLIYLDRSNMARYFNASTMAYCYPYSSGVNHAVTIVGWDDTFSKNNFAAGSGVSGDGAWIVKNSWGPNWGDGGFFYVSYQDASLTNILCATAEANPLYANNYFYDGSAGLEYVRLDSGESVAVIFTAKAGNGYVEALGEVATAIRGDGSSLTVQVYTDLQDPADPLSGTPAYAKPAKYTQTYAGIDTFTVPEVLINPGSRFSVVITNAGSSAIRYCVEKSIAYDVTSTYKWCTLTAGIAYGEGFIGTSDGQGGIQYTDMAQSGTCPRIKVHTRTTDTYVALEAETAELTLTPGQAYELSPSVTPASYAGAGLTFVSQNPDIASVSANGRVSARNPGRAQITVTVNGYSYLTASYTVLVLPEAPQSLSVSANSYSSMTVAWSQVAGADGYQVFRREKGLSVKGIGSVKAGTTAFEDKEKEGFAFKPGIWVQYYVKAYVLIDGERYYGGASPTQMITPALSRTVVKARTYKSLHNLVMWNPVKGADGYLIYHSRNGGAYELVEDVPSDAARQVREKNLASYDHYQYKVVPYRTIEGVQYTGVESFSEEIIVTAPKVYIASVTEQEGGGIRLQWSMRSQSDGYVIYRREEGQSFVLLREIREGQKRLFIDKNVVSGKTYQYYVAAYVEEPYGPVYSNYQISSPFTYTGS